MNIYRKIIRDKITDKFIPVTQIPIELLNTFCILHDEWFEFSFNIEIDLCGEIEIISHFI